MESIARLGTIVLVIAFCTDAFTIGDGTRRGLLEKGEGVNANTRQVIDDVERVKKSGNFTDMKVRSESNETRKLRSLLSEGETTTEKMTEDEIRTLRQILDETKRAIDDGSIITRQYDYDYKRDNEVGKGDSKVVRQGQDEDSVVKRQEDYDYKRDIDLPEADFKVVRQGEEEERTSRNTSRRSLPEEEKKGSRQTDDIKRQLEDGSIVSRQDEFDLKRQLEDGSIVSRQGEEEERTSRNTSRRSLPEEEKKGSRQTDDIKRQLEDGSIVSRQDEFDLKRQLEDGPIVSRQDEFDLKRQLEDGSIVSRQGEEEERTSRNTSRRSLPEEDKKDSRQSEDNKRQLEDGPIVTRQDDDMTDEDESPIDEDPIVVMERSDVNDSKRFYDDSIWYKRHEFEDATPEME